MYRQDPNMCVPFELVEVPCNPKDVSNNCFWKTLKDRCCGGKVDCTKDEQEEVEEPVDPKCGVKRVKDGEIVTLNGIQYETQCNKGYVRTSPSPGWFKNVDAADPVACRKACAEEPTCQGPQWNVKTSQCSYSTDYDPAPVTSYSGNHFIAFRPLQKR
ncbi:hypothetical protein BDW74DRAFT_144668 [Aspergillus multicolor]|uniref:uncharacterized protein n=1 Tax=Aspergillus multicolor TaxID=41759 RepID=UPI003CCD26EA